MLGTDLPELRPGGVVPKELLGKAMGLRIDSFDDSFVSSWLLVKRALRFGYGAVPGDTWHIAMEH